MCEYCENRRPVPNQGDIDEFEIFVDEDDCEILIDFYDTAGNNYQHWLVINYCPMCGRSLNETSKPNN